MVQLLITNKNGRFVWSWRQEEEAVFAMPPRFGRQASRSELIWLHINFLCRICFYLECEINPKFFFAVEIKLIQANHISLETWPKCCVFDRTKEFPFFCELIT